MGTGRERETSFRETSDGDRTRERERETSDGEGGERGERA